MADKGFVTRNVALQVAISKFQNTGGEYGVALAILNAAYGRGGDGHAAIAGADASRPGAGRHRLADQVGSVLPAPRHARRGAAAMGWSSRRSPSRYSIRSYYPMGGGWARCAGASVRYWPPAISGLRASSWRAGTSPCRPTPP